MNTTFGDPILTKKRDVQLDVIHGLHTKFYILELLVFKL